ncbi:helix-turn-helix transcriptional regulator [Streptomyces sp. NPDC006552]|uniref:response regulator transcription factor n=1 Tax=Streptomyces sp. NPDC006552 TaxID=3157179 RepID=UPI0033AFFF4A
MLEAEVDAVTLSSHRTVPKNQGATVTSTDSTHAPITPREKQVLSLLAEGLTYGSIARRLGISPHTVDTHLRRLREKTGAANRMQLAVLSHTLGNDSMRSAG